MPKAKKSRPIIPARSVPGVEEGGVQKQKQKQKQASSKPGSNGGAGSSSSGNSSSKREGIKARTQPPAHGGAHMHVHKGSKPKAASRADASGEVMVLRCSAVMNRQAASAVRVLVEGDAQGAHGRSIKSLCLAPHVVAKKATYAVVCQVMKFYLVLAELVERAGLVDSISGGQQQQAAAGGEGMAANIPVASGPDATREKVLCPYNMYVIVYELLFGQGLHSSGGGKGPAEKLVIKHKDQLLAALKKMMRERGVKSPLGLLPKGGGGFQGAPHPRAVRLNPLKCGRTVDAVVDLLRAGAWKGVGKATQDACIKVKQDALLPDVLLLPPGTDMHSHPLVVEGSLVLQSRASCMPAHALQPQPGWVCVDCCAAPGNKTTHVAALMQGQGSIIAFDKEPLRLQRLRDAAKQAGAASVIDARCEDFLTIDPLDPAYAEVKGVILDPSCSGSGTVFTRMDHLLPSHQRQLQLQQEQARREQGAGEGGSAGSDEGGSEGSEGEEDSSGSGVEDGGSEDELGRGGSRGDEGEEGGLGGLGAGGKGGASVGESGCGGGGLGGSNFSSGGEMDAGRVRQLAKFQVCALRHALSFPALQRLVYSTCSVHQQENEEVVMAVLEQAAEAGLELVDPFPSWPRRGLPLFPGSEKLVRTCPQRDGTDGFFVACFARAVGGGPRPHGAESGAKGKKGSNKGKLG